MRTEAEDVADDCWIGIDLGTQSVRALAVTATGAVLGAGRRSLESYRDGVRHEQDPRQWWEAVAAACSQATDGLRGTIKGVAVDATSGTVLLADSNGLPLSAALMYDDTRAVTETERVNEAGSQLWSQLGYQRMQSSWGLPKALWLLHHTNAGQPVTILHQNDFINEKLTGCRTPTDTSNALKTGCDLVEAAWPAELMGGLDVPDGALPDLTVPGTVIGEVCPAAARATGIPAGTAVISGMTDGCAAQLGSGALSPGSWNSVIGTTLVIKGVTEELLHDPDGAVYSHRAPHGCWLPGGASGTGAGYLSRQLPGVDLDALSASLPNHIPSSTTVYPLASAKGERFPFVAPGASAFVIHPGQEPASRYAATIQGISFIERLCFDHLHGLGAATDGALVLTGGATRSREWSQLRADVLGRPVTLVENTEPALGMALLAASTELGDVRTAAEGMVRAKEVIDPRPQSTAALMDPYVRLLRELQDRGWLGAGLASHAFHNAQKAAA